MQLFLAKGTPTPRAETGAAYFLVGDADQLYEFHRANGIEIVQAIEDRPYGIREYVVRDLYGYHLVFDITCVQRRPASSEDGTGADIGASGAAVFTHRPDWPERRARLEVLEFRRSLTALRKGRPARETEESPEEQDIRKHASEKVLRGSGLCIVRQAGELRPQELRIPTSTVESYG